MQKIILLIAILLVNTAIMAQSNSDLKTKNQQTIDALKQRLQQVEATSVEKSYNDSCDALKTVRNQLAEAQLQLKQLKDNMLKISAIATGVNTAIIESANAVKEITIYFDPNKNSAELHAYDTKFTEFVTHALSSNKKIVLNGYADGTGRDAQNLLLSKQRAINVGNYLTKNNHVLATQMSIKWHGSASTYKERKVTLSVE